VNIVSGELLFCHGSDVTRTKLSLPPSRSFVGPKYKITCNINDQHACKMTMAKASNGMGDSHPRKAPMNSLNAGEGDNDIEMKTLYNTDDADDDGVDHDREALLHDGDSSEGFADDDVGSDKLDLGHHEGVAPPGTATNPQVACNIVISFVGAGMLGVPDAFRQAGWFLGSVTLLSVSALNVYAMLLLPQVKRALLRNHRKTCNSYGEVGRHIMGPRGENFVNMCLGVSQAGFATAYIIFISANLYSIAHIPRSVTCFACVPGLALLVQFRDMKHLSPFSLLANCANFAALSAVLLQDYESIQNYDPSDHMEPRKAVDFSGFLYVIAITIYSMEGIGLVLSLEASCKNGSHFPWLLRGMLTLITLFMVFFGCAGYLAFGDNTVAPITLNLVDHFWSATFVKCSLCLGLYLTFPVMMYPIWTIAESMSETVREEPTARILFRCGVVLASTLVAYSVPDFGKFLSLVGSSLCTILGFILPTYFHSKVLRDESPAWQVALNCFLMIGGAMFGFLGTWNSFVAMLNGELEGAER